MIAKRRYATQTQTVSLAETLYNLFRSHVGLHNGLTKPEIMRATYGSSLKAMNRFEQDFYWRHKILSLIHRFRNTTKMFIVSSKIGDDNVFYVVKAPDKTQFYKKKCLKEIYGMRVNMEKCNRAV